MNLLEKFVSGRRLQNQEGLKGGRRAQRGGARSGKGDRTDRKNHLQPVAGVSDGYVRRRRGDEGIHGGTRQANMTGRGGHHKVRAVVKLRRQEDGAEKKNEKTCPSHSDLHQVRKTELR